MGLNDIVDEDGNHSVTVTVSKMENVLEYLSEVEDTCYPSLSDIAEELEMRPQEVNAAVKRLEISRWNTDSNSNIRVVNPAAFPDEELPELNE